MQQQSLANDIDPCLGQHGGVHQHRWIIASDYSNYALEFYCDKSNQHIVAMQLLSRRQHRLPDGVLEWAQRLLAANEWPPLHEKVNSECDDD